MSKPVRMGDWSDWRWCAGFVATMGAYVLIVITLAK